jgi:tetratricopeptide (TPR) repeat protein
VLGVRAYAGAVRRLPASLSAVARAVETILDASGPLTERQLVQALERTDLVLGGEPLDVLADLEDHDLPALAVTLHDGRRAHLPTFVASRPFTHRVTAVEVEHDLLAVDPDLAPPLLVADDPRFDHFTDGTPVVTSFADIDPEHLLERGAPLDRLVEEEYLLLPPGTLRAAGAVPGRLVALRLTPQGWTVEHADDDALPDPSRLRRRVRDWLAQEEPLELNDLVWRLCAARDAFAAAEAPLGELLTACGLERHTDYVAREGFDIERWRLEGHVAAVAERHRIDEDDALAVVTLIRYVGRLRDAIEAAPAEDGTAEENAAPPTAAPADDDAPAPDDLGVLAVLSGSLASPDVAEALLAELLGTGRSGAPALGMLAETLLDAAPQEALPALHWLVAKARERLGEVVEAEEALDRAVEAGPWPPALRDLARYASDRGRAAEALALLRRAGVERDDPEVALLERMATAPARDLGRNQPCWCGSGRKYKVCHLGKEELPLAERAAWLYQKAGAYAQDGPWRETVIDVALERARFADSDLALWHAIQDPLVIDAVLFEGGAFRGFLEERGALLPEDERLLAEQWLLVERSVHEVQSVRRGAGLVLRDVRTGDVHAVRERTASRTLQPGMLLCARVVPAGDTVQIFGGVEVVDVGTRDALVELLDDEPAPEDLVAFLSRRFAPPTLQTTDGEALVHHEATLRSADPVALAAHLDAALSPADDGAPAAPERRWHLAGDREGGPIRAVVRLSGDTVELQASSDERFERILAVLHEADAGIELLEHESRTAEELAELVTRFPDLAGAGRAPDDDLADRPEVLEAVTGLLRRYEDAWTDEAVPALGGRTPREAVADPTRRDDVARLLEGWPEPTPQSMDKYRIAGMLGLELRRAR